MSQPSSVRVPPTEASPLFPSSSSSSSSKTYHAAHAAAAAAAAAAADNGSSAAAATAVTTATTTGQASVWQTVMNLMKTCMGTGCLALAYACQQTGVLFYVAGLVAVAAWNAVCMTRLVQCLDCIPQQQQQQQLEEQYPHPHHQHPSPQRRGREHATTKIYVSSSDEEDEDAEESILFTEGEGSTTRIVEGVALLLSLHPPRGTSTLGRVAWYAFGSTGLQVLDFMFVLLLLGIVVAYVAACITFVGDTPFSVNRMVDAIVTGCIMGTVALVPDMGYLSGASAAGLTVLLSAFVVIAGYGLFGGNHIIADDSGDGSNRLDVLSPPLMELWPSLLSGVSHWFGIVVFGYGVVPLTYNFQESMKEPDKMMGTTVSALAGVAVLYIVLGVGLYALFPNLTSDVLHELPAEGILPVLTRLAMFWTVLVTAPLLIVPCAELLEGKLDFTHHMPLHRAVVRFSVVGVCVVVAVLLPDFVQVLSFVGCFCVALVSFCLPPTLHLRLLYLANAEKNAALRKTLNTVDVIVDVILLVWGIIATVVSTVCTLRN